MYQEAKSKVFSLAATICIVTHPFSEVLRHNPNNGENETVISVSIYLRFIIPFVHRTSILLVSLLVFYNVFVTCVQLITARKLTSSCRLRNATRRFLACSPNWTPLNRSTRRVAVSCQRENKK